jgi:hypothetical protein
MRSKNRKELKEVKKRNGRKEREERRRGISIEEVSFAESKGARSSRSRTSRYSHHSVASNGLSCHSDEEDNSSIESVDKSVSRLSRYSHRSSRSRHSRKSRYSHRSEGRSTADDHEGGSSSDSDHDSNTRERRSRSGSEAKDEGRSDSSKQKEVEAADDSDGQGREDASAMSHEGEEQNEEVNKDLEVGDIIGSLETVLGSVKNLDSLDILKEMKEWKIRALDAEQKVWTMEEEIKRLEGEVSIWQGRTKRVEMRCDRIKKGMKEDEKRKRNTPPFSFTIDRLRRHRNSDYDDDSDVKNEDVTPHEPSEKLKTFLNGNSFRSKWDRKRISGIEEANDESTIGESTQMARKYLEDYIESHPLPAPSSDEEEDGDCPRYIVSKRSFRNSQKDKNSQWVEI